MENQLADVIGSVARILLGEPNRGLSSKTELRFGRHGSVSVDLRKGTWFDHESQEGGGTLDLIERQTGLREVERFDWLEKNTEFRRPDNRGNGHAKGHKQGNIIATYQYLDADRHPRFEVVRFQPKDFRQRVRKNGSYDWSIKGVELVPYRLPDVLDAVADGKVIFIVEGEKDADRLWGLGIAATTNAGGTGKWRAEYNRYFHDADVVIIPDYDPQKKHPKTGALLFHPDGRPILPGQDHAHDIARNLTPVARCVRVLELWKSWASMPLKGDVSDWLNAGGTAGTLLALAGDAAVWTPDQAPKPPREVLTLPEFLRSYSSPDYLVDGLLQRGFFYALTGNTGDGKTAIALLLAVYVAMGGQRFGPHIVEQGRVLYVAKENATDIRQRLIGMAARIGFDPEEIGNNFLVIENLDSLEKDMPNIAQEVSAFGPLALVVIDTSAATFPGDDENNNPQMIAHAKVQRKFCDMPGRPCVLALCHPPKNASTKEQLVPRGGGAYLNETDGNLTSFGHGDKLADLHWTGKLRGPDFDKITFRFVTIYTVELTDVKGRQLPTVMAEVVTDEQEAESEATARLQENSLLAAMVAVPHGSLADWAKHCEWWFRPKDKPDQLPKPNKSQAQRVMKRLIDDRLVKKDGRSYALTTAGLNVTKSQNDDNEGDQTNAETGD